MSYIQMLAGNVEVLVVSAATGAVLKRQVVRNKVVATGRNVMRDLLLGVGPSPNYIALGTGTTAVSDANTALGTEIYRQACTARKTKDISAIYVANILPDNANGSTYREVGLFANTGWTTSDDLLWPAAGGRLIARALISAVVKTSMVGMTITWELSIARG